jgi:hypothetical protein
MLTKGARSLSLANAPCPSRNRETKASPSPSGWIGTGVLQVAVYIKIDQINVRKDQGFENKIAIKQETCYILSDPKHVGKHFYRSRTTQNGTTHVPRRGPKPVPIADLKHDLKCGFVELGDIYL